MLKTFYKQMYLPRVFGLREQGNSPINILPLDQQSLVKAVCPAGFVEVYLVSANIGRRGSKGDFKALINRFKSFVSDYFRISVFFSKDSAIDHARFLQDKHGIIHAYVPDLAIEGCGQELGLKKGFIDHCFIQGCFVPHDEQYLYLKNPAFVLPFSA